jgi:hypothetical protein
MAEQKKIFIPKPPESPEVIEARWKKKKASIEHLSNNIRKLRTNYAKDLKSDNEKESLTALVVAIMDKTAERVGNMGSADNGHFGVTVFCKEHISVSGSAINLDYVGKTGVPHKVSFVDERIAKALKVAIKKSPSKIYNPKTKRDEPNPFVFVTSDGFHVNDEKIRRYLKPFGMKPKDLRGYFANQLTIQKLNRIEPEETDKKRKKQINKILKDVAEKVGHGRATLKKHYLIPELYDEFVQRGKIIDLSDFGYMEKGGDVMMGKGGEVDFQKRLKYSNEFGKILGKHIDHRGNILVGDLSRDTYEMMQDLHSQISDSAGNDEEVAEYTIETFELDADSIKDRNKFGSKVNQCLNQIFDKSSGDINLEKGGEVELEEDIEVNASFNKVDCEYQIFEITSPSKSCVAKIVVRFQEHYDEKEFRGKIFTLDEFKKYYSKGGKFTYYYDWNGFNFPDYAVKKFLEGKFDPLSPEEKWLIDNIRANVDLSKPYYIVGYSNGDEDTINHERAHALYYLSPDYKKEVDAIVDSIPKSELGTLNEFMKARNYHPSVYKDEMQAYLMADKEYLMKYNGWQDSYELDHQELCIVFDKYFGSNRKLSKGGKAGVSRKSFKEYYAEDGWLIF